MKMKRYIFLSACWLLAALTLQAQTTEGTDFYLTFMNNADVVSGDPEMELKLIVSSRYDANVTVSNPQTGWTTTFSVKANRIANQVVPHAQCYSYSVEKAENKGLRVTSDKPVSLYAANYVAHSYDATLVLPVTALGREYIIQTYEVLLLDYHIMKEFAFVATEDGTSVTVTPHARTSKGKAKDTPFTVTLNKGQTYQVMSEDQTADFSGTRIQADKPVAVFAGHQCAIIPDNNWWCDHIVEQSVPVEQWGKAFVLTQTAGQNGDRVVLTARHDGTEVKMNGKKLTTLNTLQTYEFRLGDTSAYIETTRPVACYLYIEGAQSHDMLGDPASVHVSPVEQRIKAITFATFETDESRQHYANIVTTAAGAAAMTLDGKDISDRFAPVEGNPALRFAQLSVRHGTHTLRTAADGFTGHVYGLGYCESYAYSFGSSSLNLESAILVDGVPHNEADDGLRRCYLEPVVFSPNITGEYTSLLWKFGDGQTSSETTVTHTYAAPGDYEVSLIVTGKEGNDTARTTLHLTDIIRDTVTAVICEGEKYTFADKTYKETGVHSHTFKTAGGCDSIVTLDLKVLPVVTTEESVTIVKGLSYRWHWKWYSDEGDYRDTLASADGCDSITVLHLSLVEQAEDAYDTICYRSTYTFMGYDYILPPVDDYKDLPYVDYTLEYRDLDNCPVYRMHLAIIPQADGEKVVLHDTILTGTTYDFFGEPVSRQGTYTTTAEGAGGCMRDYTLHLVVLPVPIHENYAELCREDSYTFLGKTYTQAGSYLDTLMNETGIISIERLNLADKRVRTVIDVYDAESYDFGGRTITEPGTYHDTLTAANGCDSIVILNLGVEEGCRVTHIENVRLCGGETYLWNGKTYTESGIYKLYFNQGDECDSVSILSLTIDSDRFITQRWNDFLSVSKTAYDKYGGFTDYQWYKDGARLDGETGSQLYLPEEGLDSRSGYSVEMTCVADGKRIRTCPYYPVLQPNTVTLSVTPTVVSAADNAPLRIRTSEPGEARLYNQSGAPVAAWQLREGDNSRFMPSVPGLYMLRVLTVSGGQFTRKIIVE